MANDQAYPGLAKLAATTTQFNRESFLVSVMLGRVNTAMLVLVKEVAVLAQPDVPGVVAVQPMVNQVDGAGQATPHGIIYNVPYFRLQAGLSAVIMDPVPGDIGLAVFASRDISSVQATREVSNPGSGRQHDWADGCYLGGFLGVEPTQFIRFGADGITLTPTPGQVVTVDGPLHVVGAMTGASTAVFVGDVTGGGKSLATHTHGGVQPGGGNTGPPT